MNESRYLFQLNHPAHFHLYKRAIDSLMNSGHNVLITIRNKEMLSRLLSGYKYISISSKYRNKNLYSILLDYCVRDSNLYKVVKKYKPTLMIGTSPEIGHISKLLDIPSLFLGEDDVDISTTMYLGALTCYPFFTTILSPTGVNNGQWNSKTIRYNSYQKMAYLHPNVFIPDSNKISLNADMPLFFIRLTNHTAYHDYNSGGIDNLTLEKLVDFLHDKGRILISSERKLPVKFQKFMYNDKVDNFHHYLSFSDLIISDGQSVIVEAAILGIPNIRYNSFTNKISILNEIEKEFRLSKSISSGNLDLLLKSVKNMVDKNTKRKYSARREKLLRKKVEFSAYLYDFITDFTKN